MKQKIEERKNADTLLRRTELAVLLHDEESQCQVWMSL